MTSKIYIRLLLASFFIGVGISLIGCASDHGTSPAPVAVSARAYPVLAMESCIYPNTYARDGAPVCQADQVIRTMVMNSFSVPYLSFSAPSGPNAGITGYQVLAQDKIEVLKVGGGYGPFGRCTEVSADGREPFAERRSSHEGHPGGLYFSTGSRLYPAFDESEVRPAPRSFYAEENGNLLYGFNAEPSALCFNLRLKMRISRCLDVAGTIHQCQ